MQELLMEGFRENYFLRGMSNLIVLDTVPNLYRTLSLTCPAIKSNLSRFTNN